MNKIIKAVDINKIIESVELVRGKKEKLPDIPSYIDKLKLKLDSIISKSTSISKVLDTVKQSIGLKTSDEKYLDVLRNLKSTGDMVVILDTDMVSALARLNAMKSELRDSQKAKFKVVPKRNDV